MSTPAQRGGMPPSSMNLRGAVDLSALKARADAAARPASARAAAPAPSPYIVEVTEATFPQLVQLSSQVPVVVNLRAEWSDQSAQVTSVLEAAAVEFDGRILLANVDLQAQPQIAQAFQAQGAPTVVAVVKGQPVPLFEGALPDQQILAYLDELMKVAEANGVTGTLNDGSQPSPVEAEEPPLPPLHQEAFDAIEQGDFAAAAAAYRRALAEQPADAEAKAGLAQVELMDRVQHLEADRTRQRGADEPESVEAQLAVADLDVTGGHVEDAFSRITGFIARSAGEDRETARKRLLDLFDVVGVTDPRVTAARSALARALF
ncbi:tetratricopeptide repeat protein [Arthrobacter agilis]|uniref:tetratricopeptide repeat protein n=1 Tax=Arthrobacter agilis TaxID=37921 RepID=UPI000B34DA82|nr:tetratricopeptide repeat protein [Arthrobacter agilis]OUM44108.1 co-chaperone YbbN [Arthrobacter agilis]PPB46483.1 co-chaperone YbbN [Arthrobacter agilis]TPV23862.1 tetratricopeptide repeat protein [Arthrobacter agilis]